jgi:hypothetical protein
VQGSTRPVRLAHNAQGLTDGAGLLLIRQLWDRLQLGARIDQRTRAVDRRYRSSLFIEVWLVLLLYGGGVLTDLPRLAARGVARLFGWRTVPDPTTFGRWLRRAGTLLPGLLDELLWYLVRARWGVAGRPTALTLILDSTVVLRYGLQQAGAERGYNPTKPGRPSHHPLFAFTDQGDCLGVRWRGGAAHTAAGAADWLGILVGRLRQLGITDLTVRLDKGFCSKAMVERLHDLHVSFLLKVPNQAWVRRALGPYRASEKDPTLWTAHGELYGARLCAVQQRLPRCAPADVQQALALDDYLVPDHGTAHVLTNLPGIHALSAWRRYNDGAVVEQRIKECYQLGFGRTAIDDRDGNATLAALGALAYQVLHVVRTTALTGPWRAAQPATLRAWLFRLPAKCITHARTAYVRLLRSEPLRPALLRALRLLGNLPPPRTHRLALG